MQLKAYPNYSEYFDTGSRYDISKWMKTFKDIYTKVHFGASKIDAIEDFTKDWAKMEKLAFINWMRYYESGDYLKYKQAQNNRYYVNDDLNYFLPNPISKVVPSPIKSINDQITAIPQEVKENPVPTQEDRRRIIEEQRRKILGRLNSAEKLLSSQQGQIFAGPDFEKLLHSIYELKKQIQTVNKISLSAQTCVDLIIRQANILAKQGYYNASAFMMKFAQNTPGNFSFQFGEVPSGGSQPQGLGALDNNTPDISKLTNPAQSTVPSLLSGTTKESDAISEFLDNLEGSGITDFDDNKIEDDVEIDNDVLLDQMIVPDGKNDLVVEAQALPGDQVPSAPKPLTELEVEEPIKKPEQKTAPKLEQARNVDEIVDNALANITVQDILQELEEVSFLYKNREISRKLSLVDIMLAKLKVSQYFPSLSEIIQKQLESGNYIQTRLEDIISKLRGGMDAYKPELETEETQTPSRMQQHFEQSDAKEKQRKEMRKKLQEQELTEKSKPEATVEAPAQELAQQPVEVEKPVPQAPLPQRPVVPSVG